MRLQCPNNCNENLFEAINAPLQVNSQGKYVKHGTAQASYVCISCRSVAIDIAAVAYEMAKPQNQSWLTLTCPACESLMLPPENDALAIMVQCPECGEQFSVEEGMPKLHGSSATD